MSNSPGLKNVPVEAETESMGVQMGHLGERELSKRELEVLELLSWGKSNKEIARALSIGAQTVKTHMSHILVKLDTPDRAGAVAAAFRKGLVH